MAAAGQGGGSSYGGQFNDGEDGRAIDTRVFAQRLIPRGGQLGGRCGYYDEASNPYPGKISFENPFNIPNASTTVFGPTSKVNSGFTPTCTIGDIETLYGYSPCEDMYQQFRGHLMLPDGSQLIGTNPNLRHRGYKMGYVDGLGCLLTGGSAFYDQGGDGGNGYRGGSGGTRGPGGGGYGYIDGGLCELIESQDGVNSDVARVVIQDASIGATPPFDYLVVAGGGGGAYQYGGGGGAGGMIAYSYSLGSEVAPNKLNIFVGSGGSGGSSTSSAQNGGNSTLYTPGGEIDVITFGGGAGGATGAAGAGGGSGGGGGPGTGSDFASAGGAGYRNDPIPGEILFIQGYDGGQGYSGDPSYPGGGGGGGAEGGPTTIPQGQGGSKTSNFDDPGNGGTGRFSSITGTPIRYAGGGGGGQFYDDSVGAVLSRGFGGDGGGGAGGLSAPGSDYRVRGDGTDGLGGGGGGGGLDFNGGNGGSGVVIISFPDTYPDAIAIENQPNTVFKNVTGGNKIYTFYGDGTLEFQ